MAQQQTFRPFILLGALAGALMLASCSEEVVVDKPINETSTSADSSAAPDGDAMVSEPFTLSRTGDPATDDVEYIYQLGLIRGHLIAFLDLYQAGAKDMAMMHAKHPANEIYNQLLPAFTARGVDGFADELETIHDTALADGVVDTAYISFVETVRAHIPDTPLAVKLLAVAAMVKTAGEEYELGVDASGNIINAHEYQDAYGFLNAAREFLAAEETNDINESEAIIMAHDQLDQALGQFSALMVEETEGHASVIYDASSRIERAGSGLL